MYSLSVLSDNIVDRLSTVYIDQLLINLNIIAATFSSVGILRNESEGKVFPPCFIKHIKETHWDMRGSGMQCFHIFFVFCVIEFRNFFQWYFFIITLMKIYKES
jgi:hypothetical protein